MRKICIATGTRAEYGLLYWLIREIQDLLSAKRELKISHARGIVCYLAVLKLGYDLSEVGKALGISRKSISRCIRRGEKSLGNDEETVQSLT